MGSHEAVHECAALAFNAGQDLLHVPLVAHEPTVREALLFVVKYVPAMRILHGSDDADVQEVCGRVEHVAQSQVSATRRWPCMGDIEHESLMSSQIVMMYLLSLVL